MAKSSSKSLGTKKVKKNPVGAPRIFTLEEITLAAKEVLLNAKQSSLYVPTDTKVSLAAGISRDTLYRYLRENPDSELADTLTLINDLQRDRLMTNALVEDWNAPFAKYLLNVNHGMRETVITDNVNKNVDVNEVVENDDEARINEALVKLGQQSSSGEE